MAVANGGSFKDGFIGGAIGFGVGLPFEGTGGMIHGSGPGAIAARTAIAAVGGGVGSKLSGGSFADGAYSAAVFHLFNMLLPEKIGVQHARLEHQLSSEPAWEDAVTITPPDSGGCMSGASSVLGGASMIPGPVGMIAGVLEVGVALLNGDMASAGWALFGAAAALVGAGAAVKGFRAFRVAKKGLGSNPFKGKSLNEIDDMLRSRGFTTKGDDPATGKGSYFHPGTGRKYYLDKGGVYSEGTELPHVDVHRMENRLNVETGKRKYPLGNNLIEPNS